MASDSIENKIRELINNNPGVVTKGLALVFFIFGILAMIGAIKNWDWLYKPDDQYHNWYTMGQVSRYLGRGFARVLGFTGGIFLSLAGGYWLYNLLLKK